MNKITLLTGLSLAALVSQASAQVRLIAGWDFDTTNTAQSHLDTGLIDWEYGAVGGMGSLNSPTVFSDLSPERVGTIYWNGSFGSSTFAYGAVDEEVGGQLGTLTVNQISGSIRPVGPFFFSDPVEAGSVNALGFNAVSGKSFVIAVSTTGYESIKLSYAGVQIGNGADAADTISWEYSNNGSLYTTASTIHTIATVDGTGWGAHTLDLSAVALASNQTTLYLRGTLGGAVGTTSFNSVLSIDNVQITGTAIPEPTTVGLLGGLVSLGAILARRRLRR